MNTFEHKKELRQVAEAMYDRAEYQDDYEDDPFAVIDMAGKGGACSLIREFVPLYAVTGEEEPQMRKGSITWGSDQNEGLTFLGKFYEESSLLTQRASDETVQLATELFLAGKRRYAESSHDRAPDGSICILGMVAVYTYKKMERFIDSAKQELTYSQVDKLSAAFIAPRSLIQSVAGDIPDFAEYDRLPVLPNNDDWITWNSLTNASHGEAVVLGALSHILAPDEVLHPYIKKSLFE